LADWLNAHGQVAEHVRTLGLASADDGRIVDFAREKGAVLISKDADFFYIRGGVTIIWVRTGNATTARLLSIWEDIWPDIQAALDYGDRLVEATA